MFPSLSSFGVFRLFQAIHQELENLGKAIRSKKNVLESFSFTNGITNTHNGKIQSLNPSYKSIRSLEDRWQLLFLRSIEWECTIEQLLQKTWTGSYKRLKHLNVSKCLMQRLSLCITSLGSKFYFILIMLNF